MNILKNDFTLKDYLNSPQSTKLQIAADIMSAKGIKGILDCSFVYSSSSRGVSETGLQRFSFETSIKGQRYRKRYIKMTVSYGKDDGSGVIKSQSKNVALFSFFRYGEVSFFKLFLHCAFMRVVFSGSNPVPSYSQVQSTILRFVSELYASYSDVTEINVLKFFFDMIRCDGIKSELESLIGKIEDPDLFMFQKLQPFLNKGKSLSYADFAHTDHSGSASGGGVGAGFSSVPRAVVYKSTVPESQKLYIDFKDISPAEWLVQQSNLALSKEKEGIPRVAKRRKVSGKKGFTSTTVKNDFTGRMSKFSGVTSARGGSRKVVRVIRKTNAAGAAKPKGHNTMPVLSDKDLKEKILNLQLKDYMSLSEFDHIRIANLLVGMGLKHIYSFICRNNNLGLMGVLHYKKYLQFKVNLPSKKNTKTRRYPYILSVNCEFEPYLNTVGLLLFGEFLRVLFSGVTLPDTGKPVTTLTREYLNEALRLFEAYIKGKSYTEINGINFFVQLIHNEAIFTALKPYFPGVEEDRTQFLLQKLQLHAESEESKKALEEQVVSADIGAVSPATVMIDEATEFKDVDGGEDNSLPVFVDEGATPPSSPAAHRAALSFAGHREREAAEALALLSEPHSFAPAI